MFPVAAMAATIGHHHLHLAGEVFSSWGPTWDLSSRLKTFRGRPVESTIVSRMDTLVIYIVFMTSNTSDHTCHIRLTSINQNLEFYDSNSPTWNKASNLEIVIPTNHSSRLPPWDRIVDPSWCRSPVIPRCSIATLSMLWKPAIFCYPNWSTY